jgi:hypothetical protein
VTLFSLSLHEPFRLMPGLDPTSIALRTVCEALARAAGRLLELEQGEVLAEFRPAMTTEGRQGREAEIFIYDTLPGGAGFSSQLAPRGLELFRTALHMMTDCAGGCDASCYRCLRSFRNKFEHAQIDRLIGAQLLRHVLERGVPPYDRARVESSADLLLSDLRQHLGNAFACERDVQRQAIDGGTYRIPIVLRRETSGAETWIALASPITDSAPAHAQLAQAPPTVLVSIVCVDELMVRKNLPAAVQFVLQQVR